MYTNRVFGTALFIEVSSFQGVLNKGFHCKELVLKLVPPVCIV